VLGPFIGQGGGRRTSLKKTVNYEVARWWRNHGVPAQMAAPAIDDSIGEVLQQEAEKGEVWHTVNRVNGAWGCGSPKRRMVAALRPKIRHCGGPPVASDG
jgi:hypothetical protein